ncbi:hypothetical protein [uncultured Alistipes sp.]|uniref:hypothetical protein n=1 Tax=uncultured Alistipes sp. TaxID=538949 RepID=UPI0028044CD0|nr:hypothetical protein [uncultured Alistipes sp.]
MDLKTIREELSHLESLVDGWRSDAGIPALERDLALGMLRRLYECVRFGAEEVPPQAAAEPVAAEMPESIDLAEVLAFEPVAVVPEPFPSSNEEQAEADRLLDAGSAGIAAADSVLTAEPDAVPATAGADADDAAQTVLAAEEAESSVSAEGAAASADEESEAETAEVVAATVDEEPAVEASESVGAPADDRETTVGLQPSEVVEEPTEEPSEVSEPSDENTEPHRPAEEPAEPVVIAAEPASVSPVAKAEEQAAPQPEPVCEEQTAAPASPDTAAEPATPAAEHAAVEHRGGGARRPLMGSLFGVEEPVVRHRHRQRVIMSLYGDTEPAVSERLSGAGTVRHAAPAPAERRMAEMPAETLRHDEAGQPAAAPEVTAPAAGETVAADAAMPADAAAAERMPAADPVGETATVEAQPVASESPSPSLRAETAEAEVDGAGAGETVPEQYAEEEENPFVEVQLDAVGDDASEPVSEEPESEESEPEEPETTGNVPTAGPFVQSPVAAEGGAVLGEVINHDVRTLADTIAPPRDMASEIARSEPVTDLRRAIGINDRFLMIRDLFGGDADAYEQAITELDGFHDLDECMIYIAENFAWNSSSDGARFLMELLERKYA